VQLSECTALVTSPTPFVYIAQSIIDYTEFVPYVMSLTRVMVESLAVTLWQTTIHTLSK